jgi:hypothetical protein
MVFWKWVFFVFCFAGAGCMVHAQDSAMLHIRVLSGNFSPLSGASVFVRPEATGDFSDSSGGFAMRLPHGACEVSVSYIGYRTEKRAILLTHDTLIEVAMKADLQMREVVVVDKKQLKAADHNPDGVISLRRENFLSLPAMLGENDPIRAVMMQPGVQSGNEGSGGIYIQGGGPDQTLIVLDGATVFNPSHIYGIISVFNSDAIDRIDIYKDAYPARFGGRLGSVLDITSGDGNDYGLSGTFSLGVVTSRFHLEGPTDRSRATTFSVSMRGSFIGLLTEPISHKAFNSDGVTGGVYYYFEDANARLTHRFSDHDELTWTFFQNSDYYQYNVNNGSPHTAYTYSDNYVQKVNWSNYVSSAKWSHRFNEKWKWASTVSFSDYIFNPIQHTYKDDYYTAPVQDYKNYFQYDELSFVRQYSLMSEATFMPGGIQTIRFGIQGHVQQFQTGGGNSTTVTGYGPYTTTVIPLQKEIKTPVEEVAYIQDEIRPLHNLLINAGVHAQNFTVKDKDFVSVLPRLNVAYTPVKNFTLRASLSGLMQDLHLLTPSNTSVLNDNWVPATMSAPPETGWNYSAGMIQKLPLNFEWSIDAFYRSMKGLIDYKDGADYSYQQSVWEQQIVTGGIGRAYGVETYLARSFGRITGSVAYTLAWSERRFAGLNEGAWYPYTYDRRHDLAMQVNFLASKHIELGVAWVYGSGNMTTVQIQNYNSFAGVSVYALYAANGIPLNYTQEITAYTTRNGYRMPSYQHLDLSFTYKKRVKKLEHRFNVSIYNLYNYFNVFGVIVLTSQAANGATNYTFKELSLFPILPSVSYTLKFGLK